MKLLEPFKPELWEKGDSCPPLWMMRQAGRYLSEYREIRARHPSFIEFCLTPKDATEVTLQPLRRFDLDGAILFSDILVIPHGLGQKVWFEAGEGPRLGPLQLSTLDPSRVLDKLAPVLETVSLIRSQLAKDKALIGFCGAPWTVATYMIQGKGSKDFAEAKKFSYQNVKDFQTLLDMLVEVSAAYLIAQIKGGANLVQIFDSWAGAVPAFNFEDWVLEPTRRLVSQVKAACPGVPIIGFPKGIGEKYPLYAVQTGVDGVGLDSALSLSWATSQMPFSHASPLIFQGNLDPMALVAGGDLLKDHVGRIKEALKGRPYIFNLGHGIVPETPISHVEELLRFVREK